PIFTLPAPCIRAARPASNAAPAMPGAPPMMPTVPKLPLWLSAGRGRHSAGKCCLAYSTVIVLLYHPGAAPRACIGKTTGMRWRECRFGLFVFFSSMTAHSHGAVKDRQEPTKNTQAYADASVPFALRHKKRCEYKVSGPAAIYWPTSCAGDC